MNRIHLVLGAHNHQPVGNFDYIFEEAYQKAYLPFVNVLLKYPRIKMNFHYTGPLFSFIKEKHPDFLQTLQGLVEKKQIEILTGGFYEPICAVLPDQDKQAQIEKLTGFIKENTSCHPRGMWLAERIWEPHLTKTLHESRVEYVVIDDYHFKSAGLGENDLVGYFVTEEQGRKVSLFPISQTLRYVIPFAQPEKTIEYCAKMASPEGDRVLVIMDDGEKFGVWPETYHSVYEEKWLERFFSLLEENASWITTNTFSEYLDAYPPKGRVYIPCASYSEMMAWSLPEHTQEMYDDIVEAIKHNPESTKYMQFLKGGFWRNFLVKYPEANAMHKKMLETSAKAHLALSVARNHEEHALLEAYDNVLAAQCNDGYWHGVFGGLYMCHLRREIYKNLIAAENKIDKVLGQVSKVQFEEKDYNTDGFKELIVTGKTMKLYISPSGGGKIIEFDWRPTCTNILNILTRQKEAYHRKILEFVKKKGKEQGGQLKTIHEQFKVKEDNLEKYLSYDWYTRGFLIDHFLSEWADLEAFRKCNFGEKGDFVNQPYQWNCRQNGSGLTITLFRQGHVWVENVFAEVGIEKTISVQPEGETVAILYTLKNPENYPIEVRFGTEFSYAGTAGHDDGCFYYTDDAFTIKDKYMTSIEENAGVKTIGIKDYFTKMDVLWSFNKPASLWRFPLETVSQSETGFERSYQGSVLMPVWDVKIPPKEVWTVTIEFLIKDIEG